MRATAVAAAAALLLGAAPGRAQDAGERLLNPFGDPFLPATSGRPCPAPLGPAYTETERRVEAHSRAERGTTCWLAGLCAEPNAYRYDAANAAAAVAALRADPTLADSAIWVTAQRRFIYLEGCAADAAQAARAEAVVKALGEVERVLPALAVPGERAPYPVAPAARGPLSPASDGARTR
jgi:BON domain